MIEEEYQEACRSLQQNSVVLGKNIVPWKETTLSSSGLIANMISNLETHRYHEGENDKYVKKDIILLASAWCAICKDVPIKCCVVPLNETKMQKRFNSVLKNHGSYWAKKNNDIDDSYYYLMKAVKNNDNYENQNRLNVFLKDSETFLNSIRKLLPKADGRLVLDVSRLPSDLLKEQKNQQHQQSQVKFDIQEIFHSIQNLSISVKEMYGHNDTIADCNGILALYPWYLDNNKTYGFVSDLASVLYHIVTNYDRTNNLMFWMAHALNNIDKENATISTLCGCAAAIRLLEKSNFANPVKFSKYSDLIQMILYKVVENKVTTKARRPFFSTNKLKRLEHQLGIGMHSTSNYICNTCSASGGRFSYDNGAIETEVTLRKCDGCKRVWYCCRHCQKKDWNIHKRLCGRNKWRNTILFFQSKQQYENTKDDVGMNNRAGISLQVNTSTLDLFVFCLDHDTNELFDGLTDRPVSYLKSTQQIREIEKDVFLAKKRQMMPSGGLSIPTPAGMVATRKLMSTGNNTYSHLAVRQNTTGEVRRSDAQTKLERLPMMVKGIMGNDPVIQTKCTIS